MFQPLWNGIQVKKNQNKVSVFCITYNNDNFIKNCSVIDFYLY